MKILTEQPEVVMYGRAVYAQGYRAGYQKSQSDRRKRLSIKERSVKMRFGTFYDWISDQIFDHKRK